MARYHIYRTSPTDPGLAPTDTQKSKRNGQQEPKGDHHRGGFARRGGVMILLDPTKENTRGPAPGKDTFFAAGSLASWLLRILIHQPQPTNNPTAIFSPFVSVLPFLSPCVYVNTHGFFFFARRMRCRSWGPSPLHSLPAPQKIAHSIISQFHFPPKVFGRPPGGVNIGELVFSSGQNLRRSNCFAFSCLSCLACLLFTF